MRDWLRVWRNGKRQSNPPTLAVVGYYGYSVFKRTDAITRKNRHKTANESARIARQLEKFLTRGTEAELLKLLSRGDPA